MSPAADTPHVHGPDCGHEHQGGVRVSVSGDSAVVRTLEVEVEPARVAKAFERAWRDLARRAKVPGFRPGKVPRSVLQKLYGAAILDDLERLLVAESLPEALHLSGLEPVTEPAIEAGPPADGAPYRYSARIEIKPVIELPALEGLPAKRPTVSVGAGDVEPVLESLRQRHASLVEEPEATPAARGHVLTVDFEGTIEGAPFEGGSGKEIEVEIGSDRFLPGFAEQLVGAASGERREVRCAFPEQYGRSELAGKEAVFEVAVGAVRRRELPALDDELAKDVGDFASLAELRDRIRSDLMAARERDAKQTLERSLVDALMDRTRFEVPPGLVEHRLERRLRAVYRELERSLPAEALQGQLERWREEWRADAERDVRASLLLEAVARARGIVVGDDEIDARIERMAAEQGVDPKRLRQLYREQNALAAVRQQIADEKALESLTRDAQIEEVAAS